LNIAAADLAVVAPMLVSALADVELGPANVGLTSLGAVVPELVLLLFEQLATSAANISTTPTRVNFLTIELSPSLF
jgi:hypothetical protein